MAFPRLFTSGFDRTCAYVRSSVHTIADNGSITSQQSSDWPRACGKQFWWDRQIIISYCVGKQVTPKEGRCGADVDFRLKPGHFDLKIAIPPS